MVPLPLSPTYYIATQYLQSINREKLFCKTSLPQTKHVAQQQNIWFAVPSSEVPYYTCDITCNE